MKEHLEAENSLAFTYAHCTRMVEKHKSFPPHATLDRGIYQPMAFAALICAMAGSVEREYRHKLIRRVQAGIRKNPEDLRAIQLELVTTIHFLNRGFSVLWPEIDESGRFDLLVPELDLEIECKSFSEDKGRKVHRREALVFHQIVEREIRAYLKSLTAGVFVVVTVDDRLPKAMQMQQSIAKRIVQQIQRREAEIYEDGVHIRSGRFDPLDEFSFDADGFPIVKRETVERLTSTDNRETFITGSSRKMFVLVLQSQKDDSMLHEIFNILSRAAREQLTGKRPGWLVAGFNGIASDELSRVAQDDLSGGKPSALRIVASDFLDGKSRDHLVGLSFLSRSQLESRTYGVTETGTTYVFPKRESPYWRADFDGLFGSKP